jgi:hypothetical protein
VGDGSRAAPRSGEVWGRGASAAVRRCGLAYSGPAAALVGGACAGGMLPAPKQGRAEADRWALLQS